MIVDVEALYEHPTPGEKEIFERAPLTLATPALEKVYRRGWSILYWSVLGPRNHHALTTALQELSLWDLADPHTEDPLLMRFHLPEENSLTIKLSLLEKHFGKAIDNGDTQIVIVESDPRVAALIQEYIRARVVVLTSPKAWLNMIALGDEELEKYLTSSNYTTCAIQRPTG